MRYQCGVCGNDVAKYAQAIILKKRQVQYYRCQFCGFIQTESPYWLDEAYSSAISDLDLGPVNRAFSHSYIVKTLILALFEHRGRFLDYGAGYGIFVRRMRDMGFNLFHYGTAGVRLAY